MYYFSFYSSPTLASFPGSTPQLFSHPVEKLHGARKAGEWSLGTKLQRRMAGKNEHKRKVTQSYCRCDIT